MQEILLNYEGIIGAIAGAVLATVATLITTHVLRNFGRVEVSIFDVDFEIYEKDPYRQYDEIGLRFNVKFYNTSESMKTVDDIKILFLDHLGKELYSVSPKDIDTFKSTKISYSIDDLYFVNLPPKELTLKKLKLNITHEKLGDFNRINSIKLRYYDKKVRYKTIYNDFK